MTETYWNIEKKVNKATGWRVHLRNIQSLEEAEDYVRAVRKTNPEWLLQIAQWSKTLTTRIS